MRKAQKKQAEEFVKLLGQAHEEIQKAVASNENDIAMDLLGQCQEGAIELGSFIERTDGEEAVVISFLGDYCKQTYEVYKEIEIRGGADADWVYNKLQKSLLFIDNSIKNDIKGRMEIVFLPYKASMWDSLESVWRAADADPDCDVYVIPIPYYERNADGSLGTYHYEGNDMPDYVPVTWYESYNFEQRQPDVTYIHNPYDQGNYVTSIDPRYYSEQLKKHTKLLVYVPYYVTSGGMSEGQSLCPVYYNADYIVLQAEKYEKFIDPAIPREKILSLGSPKLDKILSLCKTPPEPPSEWEAQLAGKKVYFYNTSINGMLADTRHFLMKMEYVFKCFQGREDVCLLWRPHPLMESTFISMRSEYKPIYDKLKNFFIQNHLGIYDNTPDMEKTIAICDAYIGDSATSVTSVFGIAGKPLFLLNNFINTLPEEEDWRGEIIRGFFVDGYKDGQDEWMITQGNKLYHSPEHDYHYEFYCDLSEYSSGDYYLRAMEIDGKIYVCPKNAQDILVISKQKTVEKISLTHQIEQMGAFCNAYSLEKNLFLIPYKYPAIVRYDVETGSLDYIEGYHDVFIKNVQGEWRVGGSCIWKDSLLLASPADDKVLMINSTALEIKLLASGVTHGGGCLGMSPYDDGICMIPYTGTTVTCWNPDTGEAVEYQDMPEGFQCNHRSFGYLCEERPFNLAAVYQKKIVLPPMWGNMFVSIDMEDGAAQEWKMPFKVSEGEKNGYFPAWSEGGFLGKTDTLGEGTYRFFYEPERSLYDVNLKTKEYREIEIVFDPAELLEQEPGFGRNSDWVKYGCEENAFYSLNDFLDGADKGRPFDREKQLQAYREIAANSDGTCGEKIHQFSITKV